MRRWQNMGLRSVYHSKTEYPYVRTYGYYTGMKGIAPNDTPSARVGPCITRLETGGRQGRPTAVRGMSNERQNNYLLLSVYFVIA